MSTSPRPAKRVAAYRFWRRWLGPAVLAAAVSAAGGAHADDGILTWIVKSISSDEDGDIIQASTMRVPQAGTALVTGQRIATGGGQQMILTNGRDLVEIRPNTTVTIGDDDASTAASNVNLVNGTIHVEVGKRAPGKTFSIDAPYLIATVKGTQFDVSSSSDATAVAVTEGVVAVSADATGASIDVTVGNTAIVGRRNEDRPMLAPTRANGAPSTIETDKNIESASVNDGGDSGGSNSGGSNSGGSNSGGSNSGGSNSGGSDSGGSSGGSSSGGGLGGAVGDAADAVGGAVGGATGAVGGAVSGATGAVGDAVGGAVGDAVSGVGGAVGGAVSGVGGAVGGAVGGLGGAVGGLLGGGNARIDPSVIHPRCAFASAISVRKPCGGWPALRSAPASARSISSGSLLFIDRQLASARFQLVTSDPTG